MNNLVNFSFEDSDIRTYTDYKKDVWFIAKDVAEALGYKDSDDAIRKHCRRSTTIEKSTPAFCRGTFADARVLKSKVIQEPDLFRLVMSSTLPSAEAFQDWVFEEVLPQIRRTGKYAPTPKQLYLEKLDAATESISDLSKLDTSSVLKAARAAKRTGSSTEFLSDEIKDKIDPVSTWALSKLYPTTEKRMNQLLKLAGLQTDLHVLTDKGREYGQVVYEHDRPTLTLWLPETVDYIRLSS